MADEKLKRHLIPDVRTGNGYDVHQLVEGDGVTLCGVLIPHTKKLSGHSDADVALHALTDALLATCGAGDIGDHFPPSDPQWKGAASRIFLEHAANIVRQRGGTITNADISLIAEAPKVGPHRQAMRENLADMLGIDLDRCSVKATTNETARFHRPRRGYRRDRDRNRCLHRRAEPHDVARMTFRRRPAKSLPISPRAVSRWQPPNPAREA